MKPDTTAQQRSPMTGEQRKRAFKAAAANNGTSLALAALLDCGVTWDHLSKGISDQYERTLSAEVRQKFAAYIGRDVAEVFGDHSGDAAA